MSSGSTDVLPRWRRRWRTVQAVIATAMILAAIPLMLGAVVFQKRLLLVPIGIMTALALGHVVAERLRRRRDRRAIAEDAG